jgi:hypothetical protein
VPISYIEETPEGYASLLTHMCDLIQPFHGYGGLGFILSKGTVTDKVKSFMYSIAQEYPCIEVDMPVSHLQYLENGIKGVNWMTVLSDEFINKVGGLDLLVTKLGNDEYRYRKYRKGCVIQSSDEPCKDGEVSDAVIKLNSILKELRVKEIGSFSGGSLDPNIEKFDSKSSNEWLARLD